MARTVTVGTRGSRLALIQTQMVVDALSAIAPAYECRVQIVQSEGDRSADAPLAGLGRGTFTAALEERVMAGSLDLAVHSRKDVPSGQDPSMALITVLEREDPRDVLVSRGNQPFAGLPSGARIGTSSPRREAQLRYARADLTYLPVRGNVETRIAKASGDDYDAVVLAAAGLMRLGLADQVAEYLAPALSPPAPGQGALAVNCRAADSELVELLGALTHEPTDVAVRAERAVLRIAGAGCQAPIGAYAHLEGSNISLLAAATALDGSMSYRAEVSGSIDDADAAGQLAYDALLAQGAAAVMGVGAP